MVATWERFFLKQFKETKQAVEQQPTPESLSDRLKIYREFNLEVQEERGGYGTFPAYRPSPHTRRIPRYF